MNIARLFSVQYYCYCIESRGYHYLMSHENKSNAFEMRKDIRYNLKDNAE
ncbi:hypothetical protein CE91St36_13470 [Christensenellaceae bacterium]|nr:hypothetical protein CE91St36_13470 [Christensenellaceae bacterium]BDF61198.1 hypothetical protein CE91St37_13480 [Christensenellaceae bacterium]